MFDLIYAHTSFLGHTGYANHAREFFTHLNKNIPVRVRNFAHIKDISYLTEDQKNMVVKQTWNEPPWEVGVPFDDSNYKNILNIVLNETHHYYFYHEYKGPKIAYNVWESTRQPKEYFNKILEFDQFWVPTEWQRRCTIEQGYPEKRVKVVPEGVDGSIFCPGEPLVQLPEFDDGRFKFLVFGRWDYRKSIEEIIRIFLKTFDKDEPVDLICSVDNPFPVDGMKTTEERLKYHGLEDERIKVKHFPPFKEYVSYLRKGHCLVTCSRSEGWNLPLCEAIACGIPTICSDYGAQLEFAKGISRMVRIKDFRPPKNVFMQGSDVPGVWAEPDFDHLSEVMREVYRDYSTYKVIAEVASEEVRTKFSWGNAAKIAMDHISDLHDEKFGYDRDMVFIVGAPRSGTTWLLSLLENHPACDSIKPIRFDVNVPTKESRLFVSDLTDDTIKNIVSKYPGDNLLVEKTPEHLFHVDRIRKLFPKAKVIYINRSPYDVIYSMTQAGNFWKDSPKSIDEAINVYKRFKSVDISPDYSIEYDDLWNNTEEVVSKLFSYLGLSLDSVKDVIEFTSRGKNLPSGLKEVFRQGIPGQGRSKLSKESLMRINSILGLDGALNILITSNHMFDYRGSEVYTYTLAEQLTNKGHSVIIYSPLCDGSVFEDDLSAIGVTLTSNLNSVKSLGPFDVIHAQHNSTVRDIQKLFPDTPMVYVSHGVIPPLEQPPFVDVKINKFVAVSDEVRENIASYGINLDDIEVIGNLVDSSKFFPSASMDLNNLLVVSDRMPKDVQDIVKNVCASEGIVYKFIGEEFGKVPYSEMPDLINKYKRVVSLGRGAIEAMMCGKLPIIFDYLGADGVVNPSNFEILKKYNFSGRKYKGALDDAGFRLLLKDWQAYNNTYTDGEISNLALEYFDASKNTDKLIEVYRNAISAPSINRSNDIFVIGTYPDSEQGEQLLINKINELKSFGIPIALVSHYKIKDAIQDMVDYVIYEKENILSGDWSLNYWFVMPQYLKIVGKYINGDYQAAAIVNSLKNVMRLFKDDYEFIHYVDSDTEIDLDEYFTRFDYQKKNNLFFGVHYETGKNLQGVITNFMSFKAGWLDKYLPRVKSWEDYEREGEAFAKLSGKPYEAIFEYWFYNMLFTIDVDKSRVYFGGVDDRRKVIKNRNIIDRGKLEPPYRALLSETKSGELLVFIVNSSSKNINYKICQGDSAAIIYEDHIEGKKVAWHVIDKEGPLEVLIDGEVIILPVDKNAVYDDVEFKFYNNELECVKWSWGEFGKSLDKSYEDYIDVSFIDGAKVSISGSDDVEFEVKFIDKKDNKLIHQDVIKPGYWTAPFIKYYTDWRIEANIFNAPDNVYRYDIDLRDKRVFISLDSRALGDTLAWLPAAVEFINNHKCVGVVSTFWNKLFEKQYPYIEFVEPGTTVHNIYASYTVGCWNDSYKNKLDWRTVPLQKIAGDIFGLDYDNYKSIKPKIWIPDKETDIEGKYACIGIHSTAQCKYWNREGGWQSVVSYLNKNGYKVVLLSREENGFMGNNNPTGIINKSGNLPLIDRIVDLKSADLFIGTSSGLSWLAWAVGTPVVLVSGVTAEWNEFEDGCTRVINKDVCHGCFNNDAFEFDKGDWNWCPKYKDTPYMFECTKKINSAMVIEAVNKVLKEH